MLCPARVVAYLLPFSAISCPRSSTALSLSIPADPYPISTDGPPLLKQTVVEFRERLSRARPRLVDRGARIQIERAKSIE